MKSKRVISLLLVLLLLVTSFALPVEAAGVNGYYNVEYLEDYARTAYSEQQLGATWTASATTFKVWSPTADRVQVRLYKTGSDSEKGAGIIGTYSLSKDAGSGVWSAELSGDYKNVYYTYLVTVRGITRETRDIYAKAAGVNGYRSMVVDLDSTDPTGWASDKHVLQPEATDAVIWEVHVRDFSVSPTSGVSAANRGKYLAFTEDNTTLNATAGEVSTCVSYLKEQGVNTVHLLPVYDYGSVDESVANNTNRNWGYDPINYNVPEGSYSTNPYDGNVRIKEFKQMVQALHKAGISVVMDVVYNHTYDLDDLQWGPLLYNNAFNDTVPGYYHRRSDATSWYNGSGCGNVTASDKLMYRKYMVESVLYWANEYHIDGFRFDLMGCHDVETMNLIRAELDKLDGGEGEKILMYGEPWTGGDAGIANGATQDGAKNYGLNERIALFCDWMRDAIKGNPDGDTTGWIQGNTDSNKTDTIWGGINANDGRLTARSQTVTYADAHDNLILWDKIVRSNGSDKWTDYTSDAAQTYLKQLRLAETILMVSQGMQFQVAGTEFARTKQGDHNSYKSPDSVNAIDWTVRKTNKQSADYYKGLIQIRKAFSPFTDPVNQYTKNPLEGADDNCIAYWVPNTKTGEWSKVAVILNNSGSAKSVTLPEGSWTVLANGVAADVAGLGTASGSYSVPGFTGVILAQGSYSAKAQPAPKTVKAGEKLYVNLGAVDWWQNDGAITKAYFFGDGDAWADFTQVDGSIYAAQVPSGNWTNVILVRIDPNGTGATNWDNKWNQTGDIALSADQNYITSFADGSADATWATYGTATPVEPDPQPGNTDYYLVGYINGADYASGEDWENLGEYKFVDGKVQATFTDNSYVFVKTGDNQHWYMTDGWLGEVNSGTLYDTAVYPLGEQANKLYAPKGAALTFTLEVNSDNTVTLSYTTGGTVEPDPQPTVSTYYLTGTFTGWADQDGYQLYASATDGEYVIENVSLVARDGVKVHDSAKDVWYPDGMGNEYSVTENGIYTVSFYPAGGKDGYYEGYFKLTKTGEAGPGTEPVPYTPGDHSEADDKVILHCWNWSYDTIREQLPAIKAAGYTAVQTSPAQVPKGYKNADKEVSGNWWALYQPVSFCIAPTKNDSYLGGKAELKKLCDAADELGIDVIVDIVSNHVGNGWNDIHDAGGNPDQTVGDGGKLFWITPSGEVANYGLGWLLEKSGNSYKYFRDYVKCTDNSTEGTVHGNIELPDLKTEDPKVQEMVITYLKELIDVGVDGFRFDAAKHIETPTDGAYRSDYWPNVIGTAESYAKSKGTDLWCYGEILYQAAYTRNMSQYTPYLDVTDINYAGGLIYGFGESRGASSIASLEIRDWNGKDKEPIPAQSAVLFAETHDMYSDASNSTSKFSVSDVNKSWAVATARADVSTLYFARPSGYSNNAPQGEMGKMLSTDWQNPEVAAVNAFHTAFVGADEAVYASGNYVVIERMGENERGAVIVNAVGSNATLNIKTGYLPDGTYYDQVTGNKLTVAGGRLNGPMGASGIVVLRATEPVSCDHPADKLYTKTQAATCTEPGFELTYCGNCGRLISKKQTGPALGHVDANKDGYCDRCGEYLNNVNVYFVDTNDWVSKGNDFDQINFYAYSDSGAQNKAWPGEGAAYVGKTTDGHGIWKAELNPKKFTTVIFNATTDAAPQTADLPFVADAKGQLTLVYTASYDPQATPTPAGEEYYLVGSMSDWKPNASYKLSAGNDGEYVLENVTLSAGTEVKVCNGTQSNWYPGGMGNNYVVSADGTYNLSFYPEGGKDGYHEGYFKLTAAAAPTAATASRVLRGEDGKVSASAGAVLTDICAHTAYNVVRNYNMEVKVCDCCGAHFEAYEVEGSDNGDAKLIFTDVQNPNDYFTTPVYWAVAMGITNGTSATTFSPADRCTRGQVVTFLWRAAGQPAATATANKFTDVKSGQYYYDAVRWAVEKNITTGTSTTTFSPNATCTRGQIVTFLYRYAGSPAVSTGAGFKDVAANAYYAPAVSWAVKNGITNGTSATTFSPNATCTRAHVVTFLYRMMQESK